MADIAPHPLPVVVLISGRGSNLQSIIEATSAGRLPVEIRAVISNRPAAAGLRLAAAAGIRSIVVDHADYADRSAFDRALQATIDTFRPGLLILAGFMRILNPEFVAHYRGRIINIHPSLLPEFPGLNTHQRVLEAGRNETGATIHFVTDEMDGGPAILQVHVPVCADDNADTLASRVLRQEHRMYPRVIRWFAEGRLSLGDRGQVVFDGAPLDAPLVMEAEPETCL